MELASLLGWMGRSSREIREMGRKFGVVDSVRNQGRKGFTGFGTMMDGWGGGGDDGNALGQNIMEGGGFSM